jgi:hypothetical protein
MSQSAKRKIKQETFGTTARHGWARAAGEGVLGQAREGLARAGFTDATLLLRWAEIVGPHIARVALPQRWQDGPEGAVLTLKCEAGAAVLLQHQTRMLIERLNTYLGHGRIIRLKLVPGRLTERADPPRHPRPEAQASTESLPLGEALARLARLRTQMGNKRGLRTD